MPLRSPSAMQTKHTTASVHHSQPQVSQVTGGPRVLSALKPSQADMWRAGAALFPFQGQKIRANHGISRPAPGGWMGGPFGRLGPRILTPDSSTRTNHWSENRQEMVAHRLSLCEFSSLDNQQARRQCGLAVGTQPGKFSPLGASTIPLTCASHHRACDGFREPTPGAQACSFHPSSPHASSRAPVAPTALSDGAEVPPPLAGGMPGPDGVHAVRATATVWGHLTARVPQTARRHQGRAGDR